MRRYSARGARVPWCRRIRPKLSGDQVIFGANPPLAIEPLEAAQRKMTAGDIQDRPLP
jgi:hypothetical protein